MEGHHVAATSGRGGRGEREVDGEVGAMEDALGEEYEDAEIECELVSGELLLMYFNNKK